MIHKLITRILNFTPGEMAAWYGAFIATVSLSWQIISKLRTGPRLVGKAFANMTLFVPGIGEDTTKKVVFQVFNRGDRSTTLTHIGIAYFPSFWHRLFNKPSSSFAVPTPSPGQPLPFALSPGGQWTGFANESPSTEQILKSGAAWVFVFYDGDKSLRLKIRKSAPNIKKDSTSLSPQNGSPGRNPC